MANTRKVVSIFLGSPGDLAEERQAAREVIAEINSLFADEYGVQIELIGWEDTTSSFGRPQETINKALELCEIFIGMVWRRWGTPPSVKGPYTSGFEEEFEISTARYRKEQRPKISLFFKDVDQDLLRDPGTELSKVLAFKGKLISEKEILFQTFSDLKSFEKKLRACVIEHIIKINKNSELDPVTKEQAPANSTEETPSGVPSPLSQQGAQFLREFINITEGKVDNRVIEAKDIARFRLLSGIVSTHRNDARFLGAHDSNLLFVNKAEFDYGNTETSELIKSGIFHYNHENVPMWYWIKNRPAGLPSSLPIHSFLYPELAENAINAMWLTGEPLAKDGHLDRNFYYKSWFSEKSPIAVRKAALQYLGDHGTEFDISYIQAELSRNEAQTNTQSVECLVKIRLRSSKDLAIEVVIEHQTASLSKSTISNLFENSAQISTNNLITLLEHRNSTIRTNSLQALWKRRDISISKIESLVSDISSEFRYAAMVILQNSGVRFVEKEAEAIIKGKKEDGTINSDSATTELWEPFKRLQNESLSNEELKSKIEKDGIWDPTPFIAYCKLNYKKKKPEIVKNLGDFYAGFHKQGAENWCRRFGLKGVEDVPVIGQLENFTRQRYTRESINLILEKDDRSDILIIRKSLSSLFIQSEYRDIEYLKKHGEWSDVYLILKLLENFKYTSLLAIGDEHKIKYFVAANAIHYLGKGRLTEILELGEDPTLLTALIVRSTDKDFSNLNDSTILNLLLNPNDIVRKITALKLAKVSSKSRIKFFLDEYLKREQWFYNVVHWLDFGVSCQKDAINSAVKKIFSNY